MKKNKNGYSIVIIITTIGFMLFLTTGVFKLVMNETLNNRDLGDYIKAYSAAESGQELALLDMKENGYGSDLAFENVTLSNFSISFSNDGKTQGYNDIKIGNEEAGKDEGRNHMIPLSYLDSKNNYEEKIIKDYTLTPLNNCREELAWNLMARAQENGNYYNLSVAGDGKDFEKGYGNIEPDKDGIVKIKDNLKKSDFFTKISTNKGRDAFLKLDNYSDRTCDYEIKSREDFTRPKLSIISTGKVGKVKINIKTDIDYSELISRSKYSIFSP